jgi:hypothetical protein
MEAKRASGASSRGRITMNRQETDKVVKRMAEPPKAAAPKKGGPETGESLDKIRDILFGNQAREYDRRFGTVEEQLRQEAANLRQEVSRRMDALEGYFKKEVTALLDRIKKEQADREAAAKSLSADLDSRSRAIEDQITRDTRALREELHEQSKSLEGEMRRRHDEVAAALSRAVADLRHVKTDRSALSALFAELAVRIGEDLEAGPGGAAAG